MSRTITISLPVADLQRSVAFYTALGFAREARFSSESGEMMVVSDTINVMLLTHDMWRTFTERPICPATSSEVALNLSCASRAEVDAMAESARAHGGIADVNPVEEHGAMYGRDFTDPDGHVWGAMWMEMSAEPA